MAFDGDRMKSVLGHLMELADSCTLVAHLATACCFEANFSTAADTIQVHGGIGFTWAHSAHLYFWRAKSTEVLLGQPSYHREQMLGLLEGGESQKTY